jgi:Ser/Thr protein kinase RdoA (MazF antagonist)
VAEHTGANRKHDLMIKELIHTQYGITVQDYIKLSVGAGSNTYIINSDAGKYVLKNPSPESMNNPLNEPPLCEFLNSKGIPVSEFIKNKSGRCVWEKNGNTYHMQKFVEGNNYKICSAPDWLMQESAKMLGKIHTALIDYKPLPVGIGKDFFKYMTPRTAIKSYENSLRTAMMMNLEDITDDIIYRIDLIKRFRTPDINLDELTCGNTHGDYFISQIICGDGKIKAVIDWTSSCIHPLVWEIIRSYVYSDPKSMNGDIEIDKLVSYVGEYQKYAALSRHDLQMMPYVFFYQIAVCDYYNQYFYSIADNRHIYLQQAVFSTKLMKWFDHHIDTLSKRLIE